MKEIQRWELDRSLDCMLGSDDGSFVDYADHAAIVAELQEQVKALYSFKTAYLEWSDKTEWVQTDKRFDVLVPWGKHRADVLKEYIKMLEDQLRAKPQGEQP